MTDDRVADHQPGPIEASLISMQEAQAKGWPMPPRLTQAQIMLLINGYTLECRPDGTLAIIAPDLKPLGSP